MGITDAAPLHKGAERVIIEGRFKPNGSSALDTTVIEGSGYTVAYTSTGLYTVTLDKVYAGLICAMACLQLTTGADQKVEIGVVTLASKTIQIRVWDISGTAVADIAAAAGNWISFYFSLRDVSMRRP